MITPFGPPNDDLDRLNTVLDAQATGKRTPVPDPASDTDALAATARLVSRTPLDAREHASAETLDSIWRNVMHAHAIPDSTAITGARPAAVRSRHRVWENHGRSSALPSSWLAIAAVAVLLLGIVGGAWMMRGGHGGGDEPIRLAAVVPLGTPEDESEWLTWIQPEECTLERKASSDVAEIQAKADVVPVPTYGLPSQPSRADAEAAAEAARALTSCFMYRGDGTYSSESYLWLYTSPNSPLFGPDASSEHQEANGREVSRELRNLTPSDLLTTTSTQPDQAQEDLPVAYLPEQAIQFQDGRIGIPMAYLIPENSSYTTPEALYTTLSVFSDESGAWLLDDALSICVGDCDAYLNGGPWRGNSFVSKTDTEMDWLSWIQPEECTAEPMTKEEYAEIMREEPDISGRSYEVAGPADPVTAEAVARAAREANACAEYGDYRQQQAMETDAYVFFRSYSADRTISAAELHARNMEHAELLSRSLPVTDASERIVATSEKPPEEMPRYIPEARPDIEFPVPHAYFGAAFVPDDAVMLADGRIAVPMTMLYWVGTPVEPEAQEQIGRLIDEYTSIRMTVYVDIFSDESGSWKLDERLASCQGDCEQYWNPTTASPVATPEG